MRLADTIAVVLLALAMVSMAISIVGLIGCGIVTRLTRRR
jgi:hypothetical protein